MCVRTRYRPRPHLAGLVPLTLAFPPGRPVAASVAGMSVAGVPVAGAGAGLLEFQQLTCSVDDPFQSVARLASVSPWGGKTGSGGCWATAGYVSG